MTNSTTTSQPKSFGVLLFPGFALLDACGPLELLNGLSSIIPMTVSLIAVDSLEPVATMIPNEELSEAFRKRIEEQQPLAVQKLCPSHTLDTCPPLDVLLIPGGFGVPLAAENERILKFITESKAQTIISVCNGAGILAATGLLDGKKATTNKWWFKEVTSGRPQVNWVHKARWVHDGRYWTSSGISAGMDVVAAYIRETFGQHTGELVTDLLEYTPEQDSDNDPFADTWKKYAPENQTE